MLFVPAVSGAATCSRANLTRCLDSACALNIGSNPAARCQYCGTSAAGVPDSTMRNVSVGGITRYNISARELRNAPTDAGARYAWATRKCLAILPDCTADDVTETYDTLIEQSCRAAGVNAQMESIRKNMVQTKSATVCQSTINACMTNDNKCGANYVNCGVDSDFDKFFSTCGIDALGCDEHLSTVRKKLIDDREQIKKRAADALSGIVKSYQDTRNSKLKSTRTGCDSGTLRDNCIKTVCSRNMANKCDAEHPDETAMATQLCKFYDTACATLK